MDTQIEGEKYLFKIVVIGDSNVGKTSIVERYTTNTFLKNRKNTIGVDFTVITREINGESVNIQFWDTAGQEKFRALSTAFYKQTHGAIIVYDITNQISFDSVKMWLAELREIAGDDPEVIILGNKKDLRDEQVVTRDQVKKFSEVKNLYCMEVSAKENLDGAIQSSIEALVEKLMKKYENGVPLNMEQDLKEMEEKEILQKISSRKSLDNSQALSHISLDQKQIGDEKNNSEKKGCC